MNLIDAAKSNKPFRRAGETYWWTSDMMTVMRAADILADDWELEEPAEARVEVLERELEYYKGFIDRIREQLDNLRKFME